MYCINTFPQPCLLAKQPMHCKYQGQHGLKNGKKHLARCENASIPSFKMSFNHQWLWHFDLIPSMKIPQTNSQDLQRLLRGGSNKPPPQYNKNGIHETASTTPYCLSSRKDTADTPIKNNIIQDKHPPLFSLERVTTRWSPLKSP